MLCLKCAYDLSHGATDRCSECGRPFDAGDRSTYYTPGRPTRGQWAWTASCVVPVLLAVAIALSAQLTGDMTYPMGWTLLGAAGPLGVAITYFIEPLVGENACLWLLVAAGAGQWATVWMLGLRLLRPPRRRLFLLIWMTLAWLVICVGASIGQFVILMSRYGA